MTAATKLLAQQALALPKKERAKLIDLLVGSLNPNEENLSPKEWCRVWKTELEKRIEMFGLAR